MNTKTKAILMRFLKGGLAGAGSTLATITYVAPTSWTGIISSLHILAISFVSGFIGGVVLGFIKYCTWEE